MRARSAKDGKPPERCKMVRWYDPCQLAKTGLMVVASKSANAHSDFRLIEAMGTLRGRTAATDYEKEPEIVFDYAADVGDGWLRPTRSPTCSPDPI